MASPTPLSIVVLISGGGSNLQAIIDAVTGGQIDGRIAAVVSSRPKAYGLERARIAGIPREVIDHRGSDRAAFDRELLDRVAAYRPALIVLAGFKRILDARFIEYFRDRVINIHPSLLPAFPGLSTHERALTAGVATHGASVHLVTRELDSGPVILQAPVPVQADDTPEALAARVLQREHIIYPRVIGWFCAARLRFADQRVYLDGIPLTQPLLDTKD